MSWAEVDNFAKSEVGRPPHVRQNFDQIRRPIFGSGRFFVIRDVCSFLYLIVRSNTNVCSRLVRNK